MTPSADPAPWTPNPVVLREGCAVLGPGNRFPTLRECSKNVLSGMTRMMDVAGFEDLIDRLGEDLARWPDDLRHAAEVLLASSAEARLLLDDAQRIRGVLAAAPVRAPSGLGDRIVAAARRIKADESADTTSSCETDASAPTD